MKQTIFEISTKVYYLKMTKKPAFGIILDSSINIEFSRMIPPISPDEYLFFYKTVGKLYNWVDRLLLSEEQLSQVINAHKTEIFTYAVNGEIAGFAEFVREDLYTEILYFGLLPDFIGKGYGKDFLKMVINKAWEDDYKWIQLNTCELDHPNALPMYKKYGFEVDKMVVENRKFLKDKE